MSELEIILTNISVIGTLSSILFAYLAFRRADKKHEKDAGKNEGILISDVGYIKSSTERIEKRLDKLDKQHSELTTRVVVLEGEVKNIVRKTKNIKEIR